eukprot:scpid26436/ scgid24947/ 
MQLGWTQATPACVACGRREREGKRTMDKDNSKGNNFCTVSPKQQTVQMGMKTKFGCSCLSPSWFIFVLSEACRPGESADSERRSGSSSERGEQKCSQFTCSSQLNDPGATSCFAQWQRRAKQHESCRLT